MNSREVLLVKNGIDPSRAPRLAEPRFVMSKQRIPISDIHKGVGSE
jgi:hypothetical protein